MRVARQLVLALSLVAALLLVLSGPGTRVGAWTWQMGFTLMTWAMYVGVAAAGLALAMLMIPKTRGAKPSLLVAALLMGIMAAAPILALYRQSESLPYIHDVTTDTRQPPAFVALLAARKAAPNGADYGGPDIADLQARAYPNVRPMLLALPMDRSFARALEAARAMGWEIVAADSAAGRIEATATTLWFGFQDDVVIRLTPQPGGTRVDVRSASRVGTSDIGANARRVQEYLSKLT